MSRAKQESGGDRLPVNEEAATKFVKRKALLVPDFLISQGDKLATGILLGNYKTTETTEGTEITEKLDTERHRLIMIDTVKII